MNQASTPQEQCRLAWQLYWENGQTDFRHSAASAFYRSAHGGCVESMFLLAYLGLTYWCLPSETPMYWYRRAAEAGSSKAAYCLANEILKSDAYCARVGLGNAKAEALALYRKAAAGGITSAASILYHIYLLGLWGFEPDPEQAQTWNACIQALENARRQAAADPPFPPNSEGWDREFYRRSCVFLISEEDHRKLRRYALGSHAPIP